MLPVLLLNWNKTCCIDLFSSSFVKLLNIRLDECSLFLSHLKSVFLIVIGREQNYTSASLQEDHKSVISWNCKCPAAQVQIWRRTEKQVQHQTHKLISFFFMINCLRLHFAPLLLLSIQIQLSSSMNTEISKEFF